METTVPRYSLLTKEWDQKSSGRVDTTCVYDALVPPPVRLGSLSTKPCRTRSRQGGREWRPQ